jgi:hypothetical protein
MVWLGYYNTLNLRGQWSINSDFQFRTKDGFSKYSQALGRMGLTYKLHNKVSVTAGFAHFRFFINNRVSRAEWRPWQEIMLNDELSKLKISHRIRAEQRFNESVINNLPSGTFQFNHRFRYRIDIRFPLIKSSDSERKLNILFGNEVMVNAGKKIVYNYFDQNRSYAGINFEVSKKLSLQLQYIRIWQQSSSGDVLNVSDVFRFNIYNTFQL